MFNLLPMLYLPHTYNIYTPMNIRTETDLQLALIWEHVFKIFFNLRDKKYTDRLQITFTSICYICH